jgi:hypothetical protein
MIDLDSRLDAKLRSFYEHIEDEVPPPRVTAFAKPSRPESRSLNLVFVSAALAVVTIAVVGFAIELRAHLDHPSPASAIRTMPTFSPMPSATSGVDRGLPLVPLPVIQGNLVANAGFDSRQVGAITTVTSLPGWTVAGDVELVPAGTIGAPLFGNQYLALDRTPVQGEVSQRVKTQPGTNYEVIFTTGNTPACYGSGMLELFWNGQYVEGTEMMPLKQSNSGDLGWSTDAYASALATATSTTVSFVGAGQCGASLNQVIVMPYPLPAS